MRGTGLVTFLLGASILLLGGCCTSPCPVIVDNGPDRPVPTLSGGSPYQNFSTVSFPAGQQHTSASVTNEIRVPEGKRLIIEYVSAQGCVPRGQRILATLIIRHGGRQLGHLIPLRPQGTYPITTSGGTSHRMDCFVAGEATRLYAQAGHSVLPSAQRTDGDSSPATPGQGFVSFVVSGRLVQEGEVN
jgi:hypothetical protein